MEGPPKKRFVFPTHSPFILLLLFSLPFEANLRFTYFERGLLKEGVSLALKTELMNVFCPKIACNDKMMFYIRVLDTQWMSFSRSVSFVY